jgi:hypothetical protein
MNRLLQGDVGAGKTAVAFAAALQVALLARLPGRGDDWTARAARCRIPGASVAAARCDHLATARYRLGLSDAARAARCAGTWLAP